MTLVHSSAAVTVLQKLTQEQPDRIYFQSIFRSGSVTETTTCNVCLNATQHQLCNYTDLHTGDPWFCYKPTKLDCGARVTHKVGGFKQNLKPKEEMLFQRQVLTFFAERYWKFILPTKLTCRSVTRPINPVFQSDKAASHPSEPGIKTYIFGLRPRHLLDTYMTILLTLQREKRLSLQWLQNVTLYYHLVVNFVSCWMARV